MLFRSSDQAGHFSRECPQNAAGRGAPPPKKVVKPVGAGRGRVTHVTIEDAQDDPSVLLGEIRINSIPAIALFDSGASHTFMSENFAQMHGIPLQSMPKALLVQSPGSNWRTTLVTPEILINVGSLQFPTTFFALKSPDIDVILGMD